MLKSALKYLGEKAFTSEFPCRVMLEPLGIRINMWKRTDDNIYADRNHMIGWTEIDYVDEKNVDMIFDSLNFYIVQRIKALRKQRQQAQEALNENPPSEDGPIVRAFKNMQDYERKTRGD